MFLNAASAPSGATAKVWYLGTGKSINIADILPNDYQNLTEDNFIVLSSSGSNASKGGIYGSSGYNSFKVLGGASSVSKSYNASTGVLTIGASTGAQLSVSGSWYSVNGSSSTIAYLVIGDMIIN